MTDGALGGEKGTRIPFSYTVRATFTDPAVAEEWVKWMRATHLRDVCAAGALDAEVIRLDGEPGGAVVCEARYHFASRGAFAAYERDHAPRLRAEGRAKFPPERGPAYTRFTGEVAARFGSWP